MPLQTLGLIRLLCTFLGLARLVKQSWIPEIFVAKVIWSCSWASWCLAIGLVISYQNVKNSYTTLGLSPLIRRCWFFCGMALKCLFDKNRLNIPLCCMPDLLSFPFWWWLHTNGIRNGCVSRRLLESLFSEYLWSFIWFVHQFIRLRCWYCGFILLANSIIFLCSQSDTERDLISKEFLFMSINCWVSSFAWSALKWNHTTSCA